METMFMQNFGGQTKSIMVFLNWPIDTKVYSAMDRRINKPYYLAIMMY